MKRTLVCSMFTAFSMIVAPLQSAAQSRPWVTAYVAGWQLGNGQNGYLPISAVDFSAMTHVVHFSIVPRGDGSLDTTSNSISAAGSRALVRAAHAGGAKVLISVGGWGSEPGFLGATNGVLVKTFVNNLMAFVTQAGYDGIDIDWEPLAAADAGNFTSLAAALRAARPSLVLTTTCISGNERLMSSAQGYFDQINIMTYDMSFASQGWVTWHNSPVYNGGQKFPGINAFLPSIDGDVKNFESAGVAASKLGIGIEFGGAIWRGVTVPLEGLTTLASVSYDVPLYAADKSGIMQKYYTAANYRWDEAAEAGYLSISGILGVINGLFISYDDSSSIAAKARYIRSAGIGGLIIYELGMGYPGNGTYPLLRNVKTSFADSTVSMPPPPPPPPTPPPTGNPSVAATLPALDQNFPNPFNSATVITVRLAGPSHVTVLIYNDLGSAVAHLVDADLAEGNYPVVFDGKNLSSGTYFCVAEIYTRETGLMQFESKMLLLK